MKGSSMKPERRSWSHEFEARVANDGSASIEGYASVFDKDSQPLGWDGFIERVAPGSFKKTLQEADVRALFNHEPNLVLGRNRNGTLEMKEDSTGLHYKVDIDMDNTDARNVYRMIERGDVSQSSFSFITVRDEWDYSKEDEGPVTRTLKEVKLFDVSPVTYPAYLDASVDVKRALRSLSDASGKSVEELEQHAREGDLKHFVTSDEPEPVEGRDEHPRATLSVVRKRLQLLELKRPA